MSWLMLSHSGAVLFEDAMCPGYVLIQSVLMVRRQGLYIVCNLRPISWSPFEQSSNQKENILNVLIWQFVTAVIMRSKIFACRDVCWLLITVAKKARLQVVTCKVQRKET